MQNEQTTGLRTIDKDYVTIVKQASDKVTGFSQLYKEMERAISITGKSKSTLTNYSRQLAHLALHYNCFPLDLDAEQAVSYTHLRAHETGRNLVCRLLLEKKKKKKKKNHTKII